MVDEIMSSVLRMTMYANLAFMRWENLSRSSAFSGVLNHAFAYIGIYLIPFSKTVVDRKAIFIWNLPPNNTKVVFSINWSKTVTGTFLSSEIRQLI